MVKTYRWIRRWSDFVIRLMFQSIAARVKRCVNRHDFSTALVIFPILKHLLILKPDFEKTIETCDRTVRTQFSVALNTLQTTVSHYVPKLRIYPRLNLMCIFTVFWERMKEDSGPVRMHNTIFEISIFSRGCKY